MRLGPRVTLERVAVLVGTGYLACAITPRLLSSAGIDLPLASFYWSLPGALLGCGAYAAVTGLRGRRQSALGLVASGAIGLLLSGIVVLRLPVTIRPLASTIDGFSFFGRAAYGVLCDLSAIVFLFALFLTAYVPHARGGHEGDDEKESAAG